MLLLLPFLLVFGIHQSTMKVSQSSYGDMAWMTDLFAKTVKVGSGLSNSSLSFQRCHINFDLVVRESPICQ